MGKKIKKMSNEIQIVLIIVIVHCIRLNSLITKQEKSLLAQKWDRNIHRKESREVIKNS